MCRGGRGVLLQRRSWRQGLCKARPLAVVLCVRCPRRSVVSACCPSGVCRGSEARVGFGALRKGRRVGVLLGRG
eukprot:159723-Lingulodinium_polyedra.AAC.1